MSRSSSVIGPSGSTGPMGIRCRARSDPVGRRLLAGAGDRVHYAVGAGQPVLVVVRRLQRHDDAYRDVPRRLHRQPEQAAPKDDVIKPLIEPPSRGPPPARLEGDVLASGAHTIQEHAPDARLPAPGLCSMAGLVLHCPASVCDSRVASGATAGVSDRRSAAAYSASLMPNLPS